jgi:hypothetical protein
MFLLILSTFLMSWIFFEAFDSQIFFSTKVTVSLFLGEETSFIVSEIFFLSSSLLRAKEWNYRILGISSFSGDKGYEVVFYGVNILRALLWRNLIFLA